MLNASPQLPLASLTVQHAVTDDLRHLRISPQGDSFGNSNTHSYFGSYRIDSPRRRTRTRQDDGAYVGGDVVAPTAFDDKIEHSLARTQSGPYSSGSLRLTTHLSRASSPDVHFGLLGSLPTIGIWLSDSLKELTECPLCARDDDIPEPSELALVKAKQLLEEVSAYAIDRPDVYPMEEGSIAIDFRNPDSKSGVLFLIEQDGSGALFHRTNHSKGRLRVHDAADLLREGGTMELKTDGYSIVKEQMDKPALDSIANSEKLGREEQSQSNAKRAFRRLKTEGKARVPVSKFMPPKNTNDVSVNRMDLAAVVTLAELGSRNARKAGKTFWGWYTLTAREIEEVGCTVKASPLDDNPFHADIVLPVPLDAEDRKDDLTEYARDLAYHATFFTWGEWSSEIL